MADTVLLAIVFQYDNLSGAIHDLKRIVKCAKKYHWKPIIFTDLVLDTKYKTRIVRTELDWINAISYYKELDRVILYYSGHGDSTSILLPSSESIPYLRFRKDIESIVNKGADIFAIMDCCHGPSLSLPLTLSNKLCLNDSYEASNRNWLLLTIEGKDSVAKSDTHKGSIFTEAIIQILYAQIFDLNQLSDYVNNTMKNKLDGTGHEQRITIHTSFYIKPLLWWWIIYGNDIKLDWTCKKLLY